MKASWQEDYFKVLIRLRLLLPVNPKQAAKNAIGAILLDENLAGLLLIEPRCLGKVTLACFAAPVAHIAEHFTIAGKKLPTVHAKMDWTLRPARRQTASAALAVQCNRAHHWPSVFFTNQHMSRCPLAGQVT